MEHFESLLFNAAILTLMGFVYTRMFRLLRKHKLLKRIIDGILFGLIAIAVMSFSANFRPGLIFDARSIIISIAGFFGGPIPAAISVLFAVVYRIILGGIGIVPGCLSAVFSGAVGIGYYYLRRKYPTVTKPLYIYFFGLMVHIGVLLCMFSLPYYLAIDIIENMAVPIMTIFPLASFIVVSLILDKEARVTAEDNLRTRDKLHTSLLNNLTTGIMIHAPDGRVVFSNPKVSELLGMPQDELLGKNPEEFIKQFICLNGSRVRRNEYPANWVKAELEPAPEYVMGVKRSGEEITWLLISAFPEFDSRQRLEQIVLTFTDITKGKSIHKALEEKEENLRITLNSIGDGVIATDINRKVIRMNPEAERLTGWTFAAAKNKALQKIFNIINAITLEPVHVDAMKNTLLRDTNILISKDGTKYRISDSCSSITDNEGNVTGVILVFRDITDEYKMQVELKNNEERFRSIFENAPVLINAFDEDGKCVLWNKECQKVFGWTIDELNASDDPLSNFYLDLVERNRLKESFIKEPDCIFKEWHPLTKDGRTLTTIWANFFRLGDVGISLGYDITEKKRNEEKLVNLSNLLDEIQTVSEVGGWEVDFEKNTHTWTRENYRIHETTPEEYTPTLESAIDFYAPESKPIIKKAVEDAFETGKPFNLELDVITAKGRRITVHTSSKVIQENGKTIRMLGAFQDITQRKMVEKNLKKALIQAEDANRAKSEFLATMSHEVRTPLNGLMGFSDIMEEILQRSKEYRERDKLLHYLEIMKKCGQSLTELINDILELASIEAGKREAFFEEFSPEEQIREGIDILGFRADEKGIELISEIKNLPDVVFGPSRSLKQIIFNLVGNAIKFTEKGKILIKSDFRDGKLLVQVIDTGIGIPGDMLKKILEPFTQVDQSQSRKYRGTGLGLTIASKTIDGLGGKMKIESTLGKGTTISFSLPVKPVSNAAKKKPEERKTNLIATDQRILAIEDDEITVLYLKEILSTICNDFKIAESFAEMQEICNNGYVPDIALIDISLPDADGFECLNWLKEKFPENNISFLAQTANVLREDTRKYEKAGFHDFMGKPYNKEDFIRIVSKYISNRSPA